MKQNQEIILITGMSGAGKTTALDDFEKLGYFTVNNLPVTWLPKLIRTLRGHSSIHRAALNLDLRSSREIAKVDDQLERALSAAQAKVLFMDASDAQLVARFKEHRKAHPFSPKSRVIDGIQKERQALTGIKRTASVVLNTTHLTPANLALKLANNFKPFRTTKFHIDVMSFGFKYGMPLDADLMFDVRFLPNPFYIQKLKHLTGLDRAVYDYVIKQPATQGFLKRLLNLLNYSIPGYIREGKPSLTIAVGCTGGQHRSVTIARKVGQVLSRKYPVNVSHRDVYRDLKLEKRIKREKNS